MRSRLIAMTNPIYAAIDLELTGLKVGDAEIIEIGVVRCTPERVLERWNSLVRPYSMPDLRIQRLTGIRPEQLRDAPLLDDLAATLRELLADATPIGHNVKFDLDHLGAAGIDASRQYVDTLPIAQVLDPTAPSHRLGDLCARHGIAMARAHRAPTDAEASRELLVALLRLWGGLSASQREQIALADRAMALDSPLRTFIALTSSSAPGASRRAPERSAAPAQRPDAPQPPPRVELPAQSLAKLTAAIFDTAADHRSSSGMERRSQQRDMALDVAKALDGSQLTLVEAETEAGLDGGQHALVEAGTGVGKSLAYLVPAALWAMREGRRVIVSTYTRNLQAQLSEDDFALLRRMLDYAQPGLGAALRATVLKGRGNYLCRRALDTALARSAAPGREAALEVGEGLLLARAAVWSELSDCSGDREQLRLSRELDDHWARLSADRTACLNDGTQHVATGACFLARAFDDAASAHLTVVNHAWLISNLEAARQARLEAPDDADFAHLSESDAVIIDEAHFLEDAATNALRTSVNENTLDATFDAISSTDRRRSGTLARRAEDALPASADNLADAATAARDAVESAWFGFTQFLNQFAQGDAVVFSAGMRSQPDWHNIEQLAESAGMSLADLSRQLRELARAIEANARSNQTDRGEIAEDARNAADACDEAAEALSLAISADPAQTVVWLERRRPQQRSRQRRAQDVVALDAAPIDIGKMLDALLWSRCPRVVLTGATLTVDNKWDFLRRRLGLPETLESQYDSPFDYERNGRIYVADDMPSIQGPTDVVVEALADAILPLARAAGGRTLALFTAHGTMRRAADRLRPALQNSGIALAVQGPDGSPAQVVDDLRSNPRTVVFGVAALWTGVDVPGETLSQVIVCRLPFDRPNDPIQSARAEQYDNAFADLQVPTAILKLRQGVGRLIRTSEDRGVIVILDNRVATKRYGKRFRDALPPAPYQELPIQRIAAEVQAFLPPLPPDERQG